jgi:hypothetical protein
MQVTISPTLNWPIVPSTPIPKSYSDNPDFVWAMPTP